MDWTSVVTQPLGWAGLALALLFGLAARRSNTVLITSACIFLAAFAIVGGWLLAYRSVTPVSGSQQVGQLGNAATEIPSAQKPPASIAVSASGNCPQAVGGNTVSGNITNNCNSTSAEKP